MSLKFDTSTSPGEIFPPLGKPEGTNATPYGLRSPFDGTVDETRYPGKNWFAATAWVAANGNQAQAVTSIEYAAAYTPQVLAFGCVIVCSFPKSERGCVG